MCNMTFFVLSSRSFVNTVDKQRFTFNFIFLFHEIYSTVLEI